MSQHAFSHPGLTAAHIERAIAVARNSYTHQPAKVPTVGELQDQLRHRRRPGNSKANIQGVFNHIEATIVKADRAMRLLGNRCDTEFRQGLLKTIPDLLHYVGVCLTKIPPNIRQEAAPILLDVMLEVDSGFYRHTMSVIAERFTDDHFTNVELRNLDVYMQNKLISSLFAYTHRLGEKLGSDAAAYVRYLEQDEAEAERGRRSVKAGDFDEDETVTESHFADAVYACMAAYEHHNIVLGDHMQWLNKEMLKALVLFVDVMDGEAGSTELLTRYTDYATSIVEHQLPENLDRMEDEAERTELEVPDASKDAAVEVKKEEMEKMEKEKMDKERVEKERMEEEEMEKMEKVERALNTEMEKKKAELLGIEEGVKKVKEAIEELKKEAKKEAKEAGGLREVEGFTFTNRSWKEMTTYEAVWANLEDKLYAEAVLNDAGFVDVCPEDVPKGTEVEPQRQQKVEPQPKKGRWWPSSWFR